MGSYTFILVIVVTCFQLKERDFSLSLPGSFTMTEHPRGWPTQRQDPLLKQHKCFHLRALLRTALLPPIPSPSLLLLSSCSPGAPASRKSSLIPPHLSNGHKVFRHWVLKSELRQTLVLEPPGAYLCRWELFPAPGTPRLLTLRAWALPSPRAQSLTQRKAWGSPWGDLGQDPQVIQESTEFPGTEGNCGPGGPWSRQAAWKRLVQGTPGHAGPAFQNREKYLLPFLSLQTMDFLLCLLTLLGSYIELPAYLKFVSRSSSRAVSMSHVP